MMLETVTALTGAPVSLDQGEAHANSQTEPQAGPDERTLMSRVLLIEDDAETAREIMAELVDRGFEVDWAATGIEGLDKARDRKSTRLNSSHRSLSRMPSSA